MIHATLFTDSLVDSKRIVQHYKIILTPFRKRVLAHWPYQMQSYLRTHGVVISSSCERSTKFWNLASCFIDGYDVTKWIYKSKLKRWLHFKTLSPKNYSGSDENEHAHRIVHVRIPMHGSIMERFSLGNKRNGLDSCLTPHNII